MMRMETRLEKMLILSYFLRVPETFIMALPMALLRDYPPTTSVLDQSYQQFFFKVPQC